MSASGCQAALEGRAVVNLQMQNTFGAFVDMNDALKVRPLIPACTFLLCSLFELNKNATPLSDFQDCRAADQQRSRTSGANTVPTFPNFPVIPRNHNSLSITSACALLPYLLLSCEFPLDVHTFGSMTDVEDVSSSSQRDVIPYAARFHGPCQLTVEIPVCRAVPSEFARLQQT